MCIGNFPDIWVRNNYVTSLGIYLVLPVAFGRFLAIAVVLTTAFWLGLFSYKHLDDAEWWRFTLHDNASRFLRASIAVAIVALGAAAYRLLSARRYPRTSVSG
jgi:lysylphosphatidylglycerol synthetase-like protein (DUF2156 family)